MHGMMDCEMNGWTGAWMYGYDRFMTWRMDRASSRVGWYDGMDGTDGWMDGGCGWYVWDRGR